jgi:hypothetical protein
MNSSPIITQNLQLEVIQKVLVTFHPMILTKKHLGLNIYIHFLNSIFEFSRNLIKTDCMKENQLSD